MKNRRVIRWQAYQARVAGSLLLILLAIAGPGTNADATALVFAHEELASDLPGGSTEPSVATDPGNPNRAYVMSRVNSTVKVWYTHELLRADDQPRWSPLTTKDGANNDVDVSVGRNGVVLLTTLREYAIYRNSVSAWRDLPSPGGFGSDRQWIVAGSEPLDPMMPNGAQLDTAHFIIVQTGSHFRQQYAKLRYSAVNDEYVSDGLTPVTANQVNRAGQIARGRTDDELYFAFAGTESVMVARRPQSPLPPAPWLVSAAGPAAVVQSFPVTAADAHGRVFVTWSDGTKVFLAVSQNAGATFDVLREDVVEMGHSGTFATLAVMPSGAVAVAYFDTLGVENSAATRDALTPWTLWVATHAEPWNTAVGWSRAQISAGVVHRGGITSTLGDSCGNPHTGLKNGAFLHDIEIALTSDGRVVAAYPQDATETPTTISCPVDVIVSYQTDGPRLS